MVLAKCRLRETSPHTRGELQTPARSDNDPGNIPAYAGRTFSWQCVDFAVEKHPRIRGENASPLARAKKGVETSPHTRGEHSSRLIGWLGAGNIPAYAGRTLLSVQTNMIPGKHPRIRGENGLRFFLKRFGLETSPHTRGELDSCPEGGLISGNIPAYAGRTLKPS